MALPLLSLSLVVIAPAVIFELIVALSLVFILVFILIFIFMFIEEVPLPGIAIPAIFEIVAGDSLSALL
jgi:hypothetical protein